MDTPREPPPALNLLVTTVEKEHPFLKVWGQVDKTSVLYVEQFLMGITPQFEQGFFKIPFENLQVNALVCVKYKDHKYYRAKILSVDHLNPGFIEVFFTDYGNKDIVATDNVRSTHAFPDAFLNIPPSAHPFILAEGHCPVEGNWNDHLFQTISKQLKYREVQCQVVAQTCNLYLAKFYIDRNDLGMIFINQGLLQAIPLASQQAVLLSMNLLTREKASAAPAVPAVPAVTEINTYKACTLEPNQQYAVYVSFVNEGPTHFSVQLKQSENLLAKLMKEINEMNLRLLEDVPLPGTICLARCEEDGNVCRAVVTNEVDTQFKVFYVDFGNYETISLEMLYQIPFKYVLPKVMAIRVALEGVEKPTVTMEMLKAFKKFVDNRLLHMKVLPSLKKSAITKCELWDPATKTSALDVILRAAQHAYPEPLLLNRGCTQPIKVSYVFSCNRFYVQLTSKEGELSKLMEELQVSCQSNQPVSDLKIGLPCAALFEEDQLWYRSQIVDIISKDQIKVRYIDYGNEEVVGTKNLQMVEGELLTVLRPQAIECCLNGYQNMGEDLTRDAFLEQLILEQSFTMKVSEMLGNKALVELIDSNNYNVASLLLDKIAASKSQVAPVLVQAGNTLQHRKSIDTSDNHRDHRKPAREWGNDKNESRSDDKQWRNENNSSHNERSNDRDGDRNPKYNASDRFNRNKFEKGSDSKHNNWNNKENGFQNKPSWSSPVNESAPGVDTWGDDSTSPVPQNTFEDGRNRDDRFGGRKKFEGNREDRGNQGENKGGWNNENRGDRGGWKNEDRGDREGWKNDDRGDRGGWKNNDRGDRGGWKNDDKGDRGGWQNKGDGFKKDFKKDGNDFDSSGSEKSFKKGGRKERNDYGGGTRFQNSHAPAPIDAVPATATYKQQEVVGTEGTVVISWFHNPGHFYCQLQSGQSEFKTLMEEIQQFYKNRKPEKSVVGAPVICQFPEDNVLYRAKILEVPGDQYKVCYVDFGNVSNVTKVWPVDKKFMEMPAQAICCALSGICPNGENWPDAATFNQYFSSECYKTIFVEKYEERTYLQLWNNQDEISQLLLQANLALPTAPAPIEGAIEIPFLLNQQLRVILKSVNNLSDIIVALESGVVITCKAHNLEMASDVFEDVLKSYLEQTLIIYVDNILETTLDVTFYDNEGNKLIILTPDEGALDTVDPLCQCPVLSSQIYGYVSHANDTSVFIQPSVYVNQMTECLNKMYEAYENIVQEASLIPEEGFVYAVHSSDANWYRGRVDSFDDEKATVFYVDYGNSEDVAFSELRELKSEFNVPDIMCLQVLVPSGSAASFLEKDVLATIHYGENGWEGTVQEFSQESQLPQASEEATSVNRSSLATEHGQSSIETIRFEPDIIEGAQINTEIIEKDAQIEQQLPEIEQHGIPVIVSHIDSPTQFYVQFDESSVALQELQDKLQETVEEMPVLENITVGAFCAAPYSVDHQWYRAEVLDADEDITTVRFIDYGNTDVINNKTTQIRTLPSSLLALAIYAARCSLKLKSSDEEWGQQALELFENLANSKNMSAEFIIQDEKTNIVELFANGVNIKDALLAENLAVPCEIENKATCFVSHLSSPSEFWVQMENCIDELEWIAEQLSVAEQFPELEDTTPGTLCAALFPDDEMWYRARILSNTIAGIELLFIDYGNSCVSSSLRQLPEGLVVTSPLAQKCSLQRPEDVPHWTKQAQEKFSEISAEGQTIFEIKKITTGETATVELLLHGENIVKMLLEVGNSLDLSDIQKTDDYLGLSGDLVIDHQAVGDYLDPMHSKDRKQDADSDVNMLSIITIDDSLDVEVSVEKGEESTEKSEEFKETGEESLLKDEESFEQHEEYIEEAKNKNTIQVSESEKGEESIQKDEESIERVNESLETDDEVESIERREETIEQHEECLEKDEDRNTTRGSETDSGHHSEPEAVKAEEKVTMENQNDEKATQEEEQIEIDAEESKKKEVDQFEETQNVLDSETVPDEADKFEVAEGEAVEKVVKEIEKLQIDSEGVSDEKSQTKSTAASPIPNFPSAASSRSSSIDRSSRSHDDKIVPASVSRPHSPLPNDDEEKPLSRPSSSLSGRLSHDNKIVPSSVSRPQTPLPDVKESAEN
ncbi:unnamed protein product [Ceutorhynchus assimilis]|uniref:Tudor domain-containing protein n=1 Tax=Ceutorhynchus assimilis TaxID=467358 RepID=A0A9P0GR23_9CUCU|nr:unnamed protein product [Ceutorhynchus assimilis]